MATRYTQNTRRRRNRRQTSAALWLLIIVAVIFFAAETFVTHHDRSHRLELRGSLQFVDTPEGIDEQLIEYEGMTVSFNPTLHIPNWVAWELTDEEADGSESRTNKFIPDERIDGCPTTSDYSNTPYDRGHMAPAGDMKWSQKAMAESFYLTNILPQNPDLNRNAWRSIEEKCRARVKRDNRGVSLDSALVIVCGPVPGDDPVEYIGATGVAVPRRLFKVICAPYAPEPYAIGFLMDNAPAKGGMQPYAVTVDQVEAVTGYDFFAALPDSLENAIESKVNFNKWSRLK